MISRTKKAISGTVSSILQYLLTIILQFLLIPLIIIYSSDEVLGLYSFLLQIIGWAALSDLGFGVAASRYLSQSNSNIDRTHFSNIFISSRTFYLGTNIIFASILFIVGNNIESLIEFDPILLDQIELSINVLTIWILVRTPLMVFGDALIASQNLMANNIILAIANSVRLILSLLFIYLGYEILGLISAYIVSEFLTLFLQRKKYFKIFPMDKFSWGIKDKKIFKEMFYFGLIYFLMSISSKISNSSDSLIVGNILGASSVAILYVSQMPGALIYQFIWKISDNSSPALNELFSKNLINGLYNNYLRILKISVILVIPLALGLFNFNEQFVGLWSGPETFAGFTFNFLFSIYCITQVIVHLNILTIVVFGDIKRISIFTFILCIIKVVFCYLFLDSIGLYAIVLSNLIIDIPLLIYSQILLSKIMKLKFLDLFNSMIITPIKSNFLLVIFSTFLIYNNIDSSPVFFVLKILIFLFLFVIGLRFWGLNNSEINLAKSYLKIK